MHNFVQFLAGFLCLKLLLLPPPGDIGGGPSEKTDFCPRKKIFVENELCQYALLLFCRNLYQRAGGLHPEGIFFLNQG